MCGCADSERDKGAPTAAIASAPTDTACWASSTASASTVVPTFTITYSPCGRAAAVHAAARALRSSIVRASNSPMLALVWKGGRMNASVSFRTLCAPCVQCVRVTQPITQSCACHAHAHPSSFKKYASHLPATQIVVTPFAAACAASVGMTDTLGGDPTSAPNGVYGACSTKSSGIASSHAAVSRCVKLCFCKESMR